MNENLKNVSVKIVHSSINATVSVSLDFYVDVDFPILDNFGSLDVIMISYVDLCYRYGEIDRVFAKFRLQISLIQF